VSAPVLDSRNQKSLVIDKVLSMIPRFKILTFGLIVLSLIPGGVGVAGVLVSATFGSSGQRTSLIGMNPGEMPFAPDVAGPAGAIFQLAGGGAYDVWRLDNAARMHNGGAVAITLGGGNENAVLTISAKICFEQPPKAENKTEEGKEVVVQEDLDKLKSDIKAGVAVLGFYSVVPKQEFGYFYKAFTGLQVNYDGSLQLYVNGESSGAPIAFGGTFDPATPTLLSFTVNTITGALVKVEFGTSSAKYEFSTTSFTKEATVYAGFGGSLGNHPLHVEFRDFNVSAESVSGKSSL